MRGRLTDFTVLEPAAPVAVRALPADLDCDAADAYIGKPAAPEVTECRGCDPVTCHRLIRTEGRTVKPDCAAFLVMDAPAAQPNAGPLKLKPDQIRALILNALRGGKIMALYDIMDATGLLYGTARNYVYYLLNECRITEAGWRNTGNGKGARGQVRLYCLPGYKPADAIERKPRAAKRSNPEKELCAAHNARLLALLREHGPAEPERLAEMLGLSGSITRRKLRAFEKQGLAQRAGVGTRLTAAPNVRAFKVTLWEVTDGA